MPELSLIIMCLGKAIDRAIVSGCPADELQAAYEAALNLKCSMP